MIEQIQNKLIEIIDQVHCGEKDIIPVLVELEQYRTQLDDALAIIKEFKTDNIESIEANAREYDNQYNGYKIEVRSGGKTFSYKNIDEWLTYEKAKKECELRYKTAFLSHEKGLLVASQDGEELQLPEVSYRKNSVIIKKL